MDPNSSWAWKDLIPLVSAMATLVAAGTAAYITRRFFHVKRQDERLPILVFSARRERGWYLRNVGSGPAVNVTVAYRARSEWRRVTRCYPLAPGEEIPVHWLEPVELGVVYNDFFDRKFSTTCTHNRNRTSQLKELPDWNVTWNEWAVRLLDRADEKGAPFGQLRGLTALELDILRYEALARLGATFKDGPIRDHYSKCVWYRPNRTAEEASQLLTVEDIEWMATIKAFKECDQEWPPPRRPKAPDVQRQPVGPLTGLGQFVRGLLLDREE
jgi:hypothetical protein